MEASCPSATDPSTGSTSNQSTIEASVTILIRQLQQSRKRLPKGSEDAFAEVSTIKETTVERIFLDHGGKEAWLAFFCETRLDLHNKKKSERDTIAFLCKASRADQIEVARRVGQSQIHPSIATLINNKFQKRDHYRKEQTRTQSILKASSATSPSCATPPPAPNETQIIPTAIPDPQSDVTQPFKVLEDVSQQGIADVFNKNIRDAIEDTVQRDWTTYLKAAIVMSFPRLVTFDCIMTLAILESKVTGLANALFNIQVERQGNVWSLTFPGGITAACSSELTVRGAPDETILEDIFGSRISTAVVTGTAREVSIVFPAVVSDTVVINLYLEAFQAWEIKKKIFPRM
ncbi:hypothetical protein N431DRAFT_557794 [Stipitochalara longipes BDJ]|nr:hypothetical protein N431DRAFT_557794 [Stipitochalara longipes BDJ]